MMLSEWGKWQPTVWELVLRDAGMDPAMLEVIFENRDRVESLIQKLGGIGNLLATLPDIVVIIKAYNAKKGK